MKITHRPSGSMCGVCKNLKSRFACPYTTEFKAMKPIKTDKDGVIVVKCEEFERE